MSDKVLPVVYVDLDGTLTASDSLWDSLALLLGRAPLTVFLVPLWLLGGRSQLKVAVALRLVPNVALLPYRNDLIDWLRQRRALGHEIVLATAAHERIANAVAAHLGLFDRVLATTPERNLKGEAKLTAIRTDVRSRSFIYVGDHASDLPIWRAAQTAVLVGDGKRFAKGLAGVTVEAEFGESPHRVRALIKALRPHQWVKNILVFLPLIAAHQVLVPATIGAVAALFVAFCMCASAVYLINDLVDIEHDRVHPRKCRRPFAAGTLPVSWGLALAPMLFFSALVIAFTISLPTLEILLTYSIITTVYSFSLKRILLIDVFTLAALYTMRAVAGNLAIDLPFSPWLMAFLVFLFLSLAFCKRYAELDSMTKRGDVAIAGRGYRSVDLLPVGVFGIGSGFIAALVLGLYVTSGTVSQMYGNPAALWFASPLVLFWLCRTWLITWRGDMHDDPIIFAAKDRLTYAVSVTIAMLLLFALPKGI